MGDGTFQYGPSIRVLGEMSSHSFEDDTTAQNLAIGDIDECLSQDAFSFVQVFLKLDGVVDAVVAFFEKLFVAHGGPMLEVQHPGPFHKPMGHQGACGHNRLDPAAFDHLAQNKSLFRNRHGPRNGNDPKAVWISDHRLKDISGFAQSSAAKGRIAHGANQIVDTVEVSEVERCERFQTVVVTGSVAILIASIRHGMPPLNTKKLRDGIFGPRGAKTGLGRELDLRWAQSGQRTLGTMAHIGGGAVIEGRASIDPTGRDASRRWSTRWVQDDSILGK